MSFDFSLLFEFLPLTAFMSNLKGINRDAVFSAQADDSCSFCCEP